MYFTNPTPHGVMLTMGIEHDHLEQADRHIASGAALIEHQRSLVARIRSQGQCTFEAESLLATFVHSQSCFEGHRELILAAIASGKP